MCGYGWNNGWSGGWGWGGILMAVLMVLLVVAVIVAIIFAVRYLSGGSGSVHHRGGLGSEGIRAEDRLADRFARGEIDEDEFRQRMTLLREHR